MRGKKSESNEPATNDRAILDVVYAEKCKELRHFRWYALSAWACQIAILLVILGFVGFRGATPGLQRAASRPTVFMYAVAVLSVVIATIWSIHWWNRCEHLARYMDERLELPQRGYEAVHEVRTPRWPYHATSWAIVVLIVLMAFWTDLHTALPVLRRVFDRTVEQFASVNTLLAYLVFLYASIGFANSSRHEWQDLTLKQEQGVKSDLIERATIQESRDYHNWMASLFFFSTIGEFFLAIALMIVVLEKRWEYALCLVMVFGVVILGHLFCWRSYQREVRDVLREQDTWPWLLPWRFLKAGRPGEDNTRKSQSKTRVGS